MSELLTTSPQPPVETRLVAEEARPAPRPAVTTASERLLSVDAYRGFTMLAMVSGGLGMAKLAGDPNWGWLAHQLEHLPWVGCTFWDLIQPSFMFIVGVAMPYAFAVREQRGDSWRTQFGHAVIRTVTLIAIGIFLDVYASSPPEFYLQFIRVLQQIALGYLLAFLVLKRSVWEQAGLAVFLMVLHTALYLLYAQAHGLETWKQSWGPNVTPDAANPANVGVAIDVMMGTKLSKGGYVTINFITSTSTILFGVLAGRLLRTDLNAAKKVGILVGAGLSALLLGSLLGEWIPIIKRLWTASFAIYAAGWTCLMLAGFYGVIDGLKFRRWAWPFVVVGMNSIAIYVAAGTLTGPIRQALKPFLLWQLPYIAEPWQPVQMAVLVTLTLWLFCLWLYRRKIFFKV